MKKILSVISILLCAALLFGCAPAAQPAPDSTRTVTDYTGRAVSLPAEVKTVIGLGSSTLRLPARPAIRNCGEVLGCTERTDALIAYTAACKEDLAARTADIPEAERPTVYAGGVGFNGPHGFDGTHAHYPPFDAIGARNVVDETGEEGAFLIELEKVLAWQPEVLFLNPENMYLVNETTPKIPTSTTASPPCKKARSTPSSPITITAPISSSRSPTPTTRAASFTRSTLRISISPKKRMRSLRCFSAPPSMRSSRRAAIVLTN